MLWRLGSVFRQGLDLGVVVRPVLHDLVRETDESASFYVPRGDMGVCLYRVNSSRLARDHVKEGDVSPFGVGSSGQILKAFSGSRWRGGQQNSKAAHLRQSRREGPGCCRNLRCGPRAGRGARRRRQPLRTPDPILAGANSALSRDCDQNGKRNRGTDRRTQQTHRTLILQMIVSTGVRRPWSLSLPSSPTSNQLNADQRQKRDRDQTGRDCCDRRFDLIAQCVEHAPSDGRVVAAGNQHRDHNLVE